MKNIDRGAVNINDLLSKKLDIHVGYGPDHKYFINGHPVSENTFRAEEKRQEFTNPDMGIVVGYGPEMDFDTED